MHPQQRQRWCSIQVPSSSSDRPHGASTSLRSQLQILGFAVACTCAPASTFSGVAPCETTVGTPGAAAENGGSTGGGGAVAGDRAGAAAVRDVLAHGASCVSGSARTAQAP